VGRLIGSGSGEIAFLHKLLLRGTLHKLSLIIGYLPFYHEHISLRH
jgi:hypothetical protein